MLMFVVNFKFLGINDEKPGMLIDDKSDLPVSRVFYIYANVLKIDLVNLLFSFDNA